MIDRLAEVDSALGQRIADAGPAAQRRIAATMAILALDHVGPAEHRTAEHRLTGARGALDAGRYGATAERAALGALVDEFDADAF